MNPWINAMRLRTLPLSIAGIITGGAMAYQNSGLDYNYAVLMLAIITALLLQILSNFANDFGDFENGADNEHRKGPQRAVHSGAITAHAMKQAIFIMAFLTLISGLTLLYLAFRKIDITFILYFGIGIACIVAAMKYTMGQNPYGYKGLGDIFVFIFFGLVASCGTYFLLTNSFTWVVVLPSISIGAWSTAVLNLNNLRDIDNDKNSGKITIPVRLGKARGLIYHYVLISIPFVSNATYALLYRNNILLALTGLALIPAFLLFKPLFVNPEHSTLDLSLKKTALFTLFFTVVFVIGVLKG